MSRINDGKNEGVGIKKDRIERLGRILNLTCDMHQKVLIVISLSFTNLQSVSKYKKRMLNNIQIFLFFIWKPIINGISF